MDTNDSQDSRGKEGRGKLKSSVSVTDGILDILNGKSTRES